MLTDAVNWVVYTAVGLKPETPLAQSIHFFLYDSVKILVLLTGMIAVMGFLRTYLPAERVRVWLAARRGLGYVLAALFGAFTPFCSCSSIPLFFSFLAVGIPLGITLAFLVTSPIINEYLVVLMLGYFGWKITVLYVASGICIGVMSGFVLGRLRLERFLAPDLFAPGAPACPAPAAPPFSVAQRIRYGIEEALTIIRKLWKWVLAGIALGAVIHNYVPDEAVQSVIRATGIFSVPLAVLLGVPMYASCAAIVPVAVVLFQKGIPLGTALAFMMATAALSLPEAILLKRAFKLRLLILFFAVTTFAIIITGYMFNALQAVIA